MKEGKYDPGIPLWKLERYLIGELPPGEMERIAALVAADADLAAWLRALEAEHADLQAAYPTGHMAGRIWNKLKSRNEDAKPFLDWARTKAGVGAGPGARMNWLPAFAAVLLLGFASILYFRPSEPSVLRDEVETTRLKGSRPGLFLYRKADAGAEALDSGAVAHPGDLIQICYESAGKGYGAIFSVDASGKVTWHLPEHGHRSVPLMASGRNALASAFELDGTPGREEFHFFASDQSFSLDSLPFGSADAALTHATFSLSKETPR